MWDITWYSSISSGAPKTHAEWCSLGCITNNLKAEECAGLLPSNQTVIGYT